MGEVEGEVGVCGERGRERGKWVCVEREGEGEGGGGGRRECCARYRG